MTRRRTRNTSSAGHARGAYSGPFCPIARRAGSSTKRSYACTPWGMPTYNVFGWQKPCYLLQDGYVDTFQELLDATEWQNYGTESGNPKCANCMVHSGYEASAVDHTFSGLRGVWATVKASLSTKYDDP